MDPKIEALSVELELPARTPCLVRRRTRIRAHASVCVPQSGPARYPLSRRGSNVLCGRLGNLLGSEGRVQVHDLRSPGERHASPRGRLSLQFVRKGRSLASGRAAPRSGLRAQRSDLGTGEEMPWRKPVSERSGSGNGGRRLRCPATLALSRMSSPRRFGTQVFSHPPRKKSNQ